MHDDACFLPSLQVGKDRNAPGGVFRLAPQDLPVPPEATAAGDFPVSMQVRGLTNMPINAPALSAAGTSEAWKSSFPFMTHSPP